ncbi:hypothetical protein RCL_jg7779.t2 [Rhizophagus clarus]|uniref:Uncharacterized protein n=1 Tax=Rhizophagus clarus TaxID=94130 RepID=A0A8H3MK92_9GLOM|nr:hypothetical protein RCL_jg7779.t2 [Rhizophagus clarus]
MSIIKSEVVKLLERLRIPTCLSFVSGHATDISRLANTFKVQAELALKELQTLIRNATDNELDDEERIQIIVTCATFIGEELWTNSDLNKNAIATIDLLTTLQPRRFPTVTQMIQVFSSEILEKYVKPVFLKHTPVNVEKKNGKLKKQPIDFDIGNESWRGEIAQGSNILQWCILHLKNTEIENIIGLIVPPTLSLIDDYNVNFKTRGVSILDHLLKELTPDIIQRTGLGEVFHEALSRCLTYQNEESHVPLLRQSFSAIISLVSLTEKPNSEPRFIKYEQILSNNVVRGFIFSGDKIVIRIVLLEQIPKLSQELEIVMVKYLGELMQIICDSLQVTFEFTNKEQIIDLHYAAAKGLEKIISTCWPRIPRYKGRILTSVASSWYQVMRVEANNDVLKKSLYNVCQLLKLACAQNNVNIKKDIQALLELDSEMFEPLLN